MFGDTAEAWFLTVLVLAPYLAIGQLLSLLAGGEGREEGLSCVLGPWGALGRAPTACHTDSASTASATPWPSQSEGRVAASPWGLISKKVSEAVVLPWPDGD